jgi:hypothetical protein
MTAIADIRTSVIDSFSPLQTCGVIPTAALLIAEDNPQGMRLESRASVTLDCGVRSSYPNTQLGINSLCCFGSMGKRAGGICCHSRDDPIVRTIDQIVQIAGRDGPEYG